MKRSTRGYVGAGVTLNVPSDNKQLKNPATGVESKVKELRNHFSCLAAESLKLKNEAIQSRQKRKASVAIRLPRPAAVCSKIRTVRISDVEALMTSGVDFLISQGESLGFYIAKDLARYPETGFKRKYFFIKLFRKEVGLNDWNPTELLAAQYDLRQLNFSQLLFLWRLAASSGRTAKASGNEGCNKEHAAFRDSIQLIVFDKLLLELISPKRLDRASPNVSVSSTVSGGAVSASRHGTACDDSTWASNPAARRCLGRELLIVLGLIRRVTTPPADVCRAASAPTHSLHTNGLWWRVFVHRPPPGHVLNLKPSYHETQALGNTPTHTPTHSQVRPKASKGLYGHSTSRDAVSRASPEGESPGAKRSPPHCGRGASIGGVSAGGISTGGVSVCGVSANSCNGVSGTAVSPNQEDSVHQLPNSQQRGVWIFERRNKGTGAQRICVSAELTFPNAEPINYLQRARCALRPVQRPPACSRLPEAPTSRFGEAASLSPGLLSGEVKPRSALPAVSRAWRRGVSQFPALSSDNAPPGLELFLHFPSLRVSAHRPPNVPIYAYQQQAGMASLLTAATGGSLSPSLTWDIIQFSPEAVSLSSVNLADNLSACMVELREVLRHRQSKTSPSLQTEVEDKSDGDKSCTTSLYEFQSRLSPQRLGENESPANGRRTRPAPVTRRESVSRRRDSIEALSKNGADSLADATGSRRNSRETSTPTVRSEYTHSHSTHNCTPRVSVGAETETGMETEMETIAIDETPRSHANSHGRRNAVPFIDNVKDDDRETRRLQFPPFPAFVKQEQAKKMEIEKEKETGGNEDRAHTARQCRSKSLNSEPISQPSKIVVMKVGTEEQDKEDRGKENRRLASEDGLRNEDSSIKDENSATKDELGDAMAVQKKEAKLTGSLPNSDLNSMESSTTACTNSAALDGNKDRDTDLDGRHADLTTSFLPEHWPSESRDLPTLRRPPDKRIDPPKITSPKITAECQLQESSKNLEPEDLAEQRPVSVQEDFVSFTSNKTEIANECAPQPSFPPRLYAPPPVQLPPEDSEAPPTNPSPCSSEIKESLPSRESVTSSERRLPGKRDTGTHSTKRVLIKSKRCQTETESHETRRDSDHLRDSLASIAPSQNEDEEPLLRSRNVESEMSSEVETPVTETETLLPYPSESRSLPAPPVTGIRVVQTRPRTTALDRGRRLARETPEDAALRISRIISIHRRRALDAERRRDQSVSPPLSPIRRARMPKETPRPQRPQTSGFSVRMQRGAPGGVSSERGPSPIRRGVTPSPERGLFRRPVTVVPPPSPPLATEKELPLTDPQSNSAHPSSVLPHLNPKPLSPRLEPKAVSPRHSIRKEVQWARPPGFFHSGTHLPPLCPSTDCQCLLCLCSRTPSDITSVVSMPLVEEASPEGDVSDVMQPIDFLPRPSPSSVMTDLRQQSPSLQTVDLRRPSYVRHLEAQVASRFRDLLQPRDWENCRSNSDTLDLLRPLMGDMLRRPSGRRRQDAASTRPEPNPGCILRKSKAQMLTPLVNRRIV